MTDERSTTVAPAISACRCSSDGHPLGRQPEHRLAGRLAGQPSRLSPIASTVPAGEMPLAAGTPLSQMTYCDAGQVEVVAGADQRDDQAGVHGDLAAQRLDPVEQVAAAGGVDQVDQVEGDLELERVDPHLLGDRLGGVGLGSFSAAAAAASASSSTTGASFMRAAMTRKPADDEERQLRAGRG
jgi:hypothetical protein